MIKKRIVNWKLFWALLGLGIFAYVVSLPYTLEITREQIPQIAEQTGISASLMLPVLLIAQLMQTAVFLAVASFIGLLLSKKVGLEVPILEAWVNGRRPKINTGSYFLISIISGVLAGIVIIGFEYLFYRAGLKLTLFSSTVPAWWKGLFVSFYGGIGEEILMRLFLMTLLVWISTKIKKNRDGKPTNIGIWISIVIAAIIFGLGHLPTILALGATFSPMVLTRVIFLNGIAGVLFGWLYWKKGLESAMISHFSVDVLLYVILAAVLPAIY